MTPEERLDEMRRLADEARNLCGKAKSLGTEAGELGQAVIRLYQEEVGELPKRDRRPHPHLSVVRGVIAAAVAFIGIRKLVTGAVATGAAAAATAAFVFVPHVIPLTVGTPPAPRPGVSQPAAAPHGRRKLVRVTPPQTTPASVPSAPPQPQAGPSPSQLPSPSVSVSVTPGASSSVQVQVPAPVPTVSTCVKLPLVGQLCLAA